MVDECLFIDSNGVECQREAWNTDYCKDHSGPDAVRKTNVTELLGRTLTRISADVGGRAARFECSDGTRWVMKHDQGCCESVDINDIIGDLDDLIGEPLLMAECVTDTTDTSLFGVGDYKPDSFTWTFYKFATVKGYVTLRWLGSSNGYYSEEVDFCEEKT